MLCVRLDVVSKQDFRQDSRCTDVTAKDRIDFILDVARHRGSEVPNVGGLVLVKQVRHGRRDEADYHHEKCQYSDQYFQPEWKNKFVHNDFTLRLLLLMRN